MLGFLFKIVIIAVMAGGVVWGYMKYQGGSVNLGQISESVRQADLAKLGSQISQGLDTLVTHGNQSPVVLGIQITNQSLEKVADTLQGLPPEQLKIIKEYICQPASPAGGPASPAGGPASPAGGIATPSSQ